MYEKTWRTNPKGQGPGNPIYIICIGIYIYIFWKDTLRKQVITAVSTVKRIYLAFRVTPRRKHTAEQMGGKMGTLATFRVASHYRGADQGAGLRARSP